MRGPELATSRSRDASLASGTGDVQKIASFETRSRLFRQALAGNECGP
jgi:hypothetical protein